MIIHRGEQPKLLVSSRRVSKIASVQDYDGFREANNNNKFADASGYEKHSLARCKAMR